MGRKRPLLQRNLGGRHRRDVRLRRVHGLRVVGRELRFQGDEALAADQTVGWSGIDPCWAIRAGERDSVPFDSDCHSLETAENDTGCQFAKPPTTYSSVVDYGEFVVQLVAMPVPDWVFRDSQVSKARVQAALTHRRG